MIFIEWTSDAGDQYTLTINDGSAQDTFLNGGANPFVTETDDDDDIYTSIRLQTGNIQIVADSVDLRDIIGQDPLSRPVTLFKGASLEQQALWKGYLQTNAFTQAWDVGPNTISIPVISRLGALGSRFPSGEVDDVKYISFVEFVINLVLVDNTPTYRYYVFPELSEPLTTLTYQFNLLNYASWDADIRKYNMQSYIEILADVCRLFGWTAIEAGDTLAFLTNDMKGDYVRMTYTELDQLAGGNTPTYETITQPVVHTDIFGADHTITFTEGKRSVKVTGDVNSQSNTIYSADFDQEYRGDRMTKAVHNVDTTVEYVAVNFKKENDSIIRPRNANTNIRFADIGGSTRTSGCCISRERIYEHDNRTGSMAIIKDTGWADRIIFRVGNLGSFDTLVVCYPPQRYFYNGIKSRKYLVLSGTVMVADSPTSDWENFTGTIPVTLSVGNTSSPQMVRVVDGKMNGGRVGNSFGNLSGGYIFGVIPEEGSLEIEIYVPSRDSGATGNLSDCNIDADKYYSITDLRLEYYDDYWYPNQYKIPSTNVERSDIGLGFQDDLEVTCGLTTIRQQLVVVTPRAKYPRLGWAQDGYGIILDSNGYGTATLYDGKTPERALADRMAMFYGRSRQRLNVQVAGGGMIAPWALVDVGDGIDYVCVAQSVDWRMGQITATLCEVDNL